MFLYDVLTPKEIEVVFDLPAGTVRRDLSRGKFRDSEVRKSGSVWLITSREAKRVYKDELTFIDVVDDWDWIYHHIDNEMKNPILEESVLDWARDNDIDLDRIRELYSQAIEGGIEDGQYLSFSQWFHEYKEMVEE